ncbi:hypothetical protein FOE67_04410 [Streptomyces calidiresistens]|uniref:Uncharacterized protein n=2 Tax=Streptomyces calidiresistens TaxID=1485586 RepID=A0A7W3XVH5_9ACTN|nr:hypothetical protein [Streptomyces calidiresistens]
MHGAERVAGLVVCYAVLVNAADNSCEAVDEIVIATGSWREGAEAMRAAGYRHVPRRPARREVPGEAIDAALMSPGLVLRTRFGSGEPWKPRVPGRGTG